VSLQESTFNQVFSHVTRLKTLALGQLGYLFARYALFFAVYLSSHAFF
jgi:hypothetical protein